MCISQVLGFSERFLQSALGDAIGQLAHRYYAKGRSWSGTDAKGTFATLKDNAQQLHARYLPQIQEQAGSLDVRRVLAMVSGR